MATDYIVLKRIGLSKDEESSWIRLAGFQNAASASAAIKLALNGADEGGDFIAVPARSWQPVKVSIEKAVRLG